jgi:hypothetical protein
MVALKKWAMTQKFSPQISDLRSISASVANARIPDWDEAWADVTKAISYYGYYRQDEALEMMDELTLKAVKTLGYQRAKASSRLRAPLSRPTKIRVW